MGNRSRKRSLRITNGRFLQCEQLESRLPFAVDYLDLTDVALYQMPTNEMQNHAFADLSPDVLIDEWLTSSQDSVLGNTTFGDFYSDFYSPELWAFDELNPANFQFWGDTSFGETRDQNTVRPSSSIVGDTWTSQPVPTTWALDIPVFTPSNVASTWISAEPITEPLGVMETVSVVSTNAVDEWSTAIALPASDDEVPSFFIDDLFSIGGEYWWGLSQGQPQQDMVFGQTPFFEATIAPSMLIRTGPIFDVFSMANGQSNFGEEVFLFLSGITGSADPIPTTGHRGETLPSVANAIPKFVADIAWSIDSRSLGSPTLLGIDTSSHGKSEFQFSQLYSSATQFAGLERAGFQASDHYQSVDTLNDALLLDVELQAQLPVRKAKSERPGNWHGQAEKNAMLPRDVDANAIIIGLPSSLLPVGMLPIGAEPGRSPLRGNRSYMNEEHFLVQTTMICENLQKGPLADAMVSSFIAPTCDEGSSAGSNSEDNRPSDIKWGSYLSNRSLGVIAISCVVVMAQSNLWPSKLAFRKRWPTWLNGGTEDSSP